MKKLVLNSGGIKSAVLLTMARKEGDAIGYYLQEPTLPSGIAARRLCEELGLKHVCAPGPGHWPDRLRFQRLVYVSLGLMFGKLKECDELYYGASYDDNDPESGISCYEVLRSAVFHAQPAYDYATGEGKRLAKIDLVAPLILIDLPLIINYGARIGANFEHTWSCLYGGEKHCGECWNCRRRRWGFYRARIEDPARYAVDMPIEKPLLTYTYSTLLEDEDDSTGD